MAHVVAVGSKSSAVVIKSTSQNYRIKFQPDSFVHSEENGFQAFRSAVSLNWEFPNVGMVQ